MLFMLLIVFQVMFQNQTPYKRLFGSPLDYHHLRSFNSAYFILLQSHEHNKLEPRSRFCCFLGYGETQKGYRCYDFVSHRLRISCNVVFWEYRLFVELSHFRASLSSSSILDLFPDKAHIPSVAAPDLLVVTPDSPVDFSVQPPYIIVPFLVHLLMNKSKMNRLKTSYSNPTCHSIRVRFILAHLLNYHCYTALTSLHEPHTYHEASIDPFMVDCNERGT